MKIQLANSPIVKGAMTVFSQPGPFVDLTADLKNLTFKEGSIEAIYTFHILDHFFPEEGLEAAKNWLKCLKTGAKLYLVVDDFEYIARALVGGDINIDAINEFHANPTQFTRDSLVNLLIKAGFKNDKISVWFEDVKEGQEIIFKKKHYELVLEATKHE